MSDKPSSSLENVLRNTLHEFNSETGTIHALDTENQVLRLVTQIGLPPQLLEVVKIIPVGKGIAGQVAAQNKPVVICNLQTDASGVARPGAKQTGIGGSLCVPIRDGNRLVGTLGVGTARPYEYTPDETQKLEQIGLSISQLLKTKLMPITIPTAAPVFERPKVVLPPIEKPKTLSPADVSATAQQLIANIEKVIVGKHEQVLLSVAVLLAEGHLLLEDVPGVAKTMLARALAQSAGSTFRRIQCTPDLQPSDVLGEPRLDPQTGRSEFHFGPLFAQFVLVDEINRASPRTQAALLEAMGEGSVTEGNITYRLQRPFMVIATQNPIEQEGTFLLPEAQKDRFLLRMDLGYPSLTDEKQMVERFQQRHPIETLQPVATPDRILKCQEAVREIKVPSDVNDYILKIVRATRGHPALLLGASPRGSLGLFRAAQAMAAIEGKDSTSVEQIKSLAQRILAHRLIVRKEEKFQGTKVGAIVSEILGNN